MKFFATAVPGIGPILARELEDDPLVSGRAVRDSDGRHDHVAFDAKGGFEVTRLRTSEDVFVQIAEAKPAALSALVRRLWDSAAVERAVSVYAHQVRPLRPRMSYRVVARVRSERSFRRTDLRDALVSWVGRWRPRWRGEDHARLEFWVVELRGGRFRLGLRLTSNPQRQRGGRARERPAALRPSVAAALVRLTGRPAAGDPAAARLLDPFCGTGTILREAAVAGWRPIASDVSAFAAADARANLSGRRRAEPAIAVADARALPFSSAAFGAIAANLPFGGRFELPANPARWYREVLDEWTRVALPGAGISLLAPATRAFEKTLAAHPTVQRRERFALRLLGFDTTLWQLERR